MRELIVEARGHMLSTFSDNQPPSVDNSTTQDTTSDPHLTTHDTTSDPYLSPVEHPELESFKLLVKSRLIVKLLVNDDDNQPILWRTELTVESIIQSIECIHQELIEQAHQWGENEERRTHGLRDRSKAANAHSKWEFLRMNPLVTKAEARKRKVSANAPGRMAKQARDELALVTKTEQRASLREDDRDVANLPNHIMTAEENAKLDYKVANSM